MTKFRFWSLGHRMVIEPRTSAAPGPPGPANRRTDRPPGPIRDPRNRRESTISATSSRTTDRADRILDAAGDLLSRFGYRKVTIEDIAKHAGIGKGTVYLHWRTKDLLFEALLLRESSNLSEDVLETLRQDPFQIRPHRFLRNAFLAAHHRPLMHAMLVRDLDILGALRDSQLRDHQVVSDERFFELITRHRLLRTDIPNILYALQATITGFYAVDGMQPELAELDLNAKADALAHVVQHAFEPLDEPDPATLATAAREADDLYTDLITTFRKWIYG